MAQTNDPVSWTLRKVTVDSVAKLYLFRNPNFEPYVQLWRKRRRRIDSLDGLLSMYYPGVTVINIPSIGRPNLISQSIEKLYEEIKTSCKKSRAAKQSIRMLFIADELHPCLVSAFSHLATMPSKTSVADHGHVSSTTEEDRCVNVKLAIKPPKGLKRKDGRVIGKGDDHRSQFTTDSFRCDFRDMI